MVLNMTQVNTYAIDDLLTSSYDGVASTDTAGALHLMCSMMSSTTTAFPRVGLIVTDGRSNDLQATRQEANACWDAGIQLMAVGVGGAVSGDIFAVQELTDMVNAGSESVSGSSRLKRLFLVPDFPSLSTITPTIGDILCESKLTFALSHQQLPVHFVKVYNLS